MGSMGGGRGLQGHQQLSSLMEAVDVTKARTRGRGGTRGSGSPGVFLLKGGGWPRDGAGPKGAQSGPGAGWAWLRGGVTLPRTPYGPCRRSGCTAAAGPLDCSPSYRAPRKKRRCWHRSPAKSRAWPEPRAWRATGGGGAGCVAGTRVTSGLFLSGFTMPDPTGAAGGGGPCRPLVLWLLRWLPGWPLGGGCGRRKAPAGLPGLGSRSLGLQGSFQRWGVHSTKEGPR